MLFVFAVGVYLLRRAYYFFASSAFSICTWRARISSALSILRSSTWGSTIMVTDFVSGVCLFVGFGCCLMVSIGNVLDDGGSVRSITLERSIRLSSVGAGNYWGY